MKKLAFGALIAGLLVACGGDDGNGKIVVNDGGMDAAMVCNPLTQAGCAAGEKCTWIIDALMPQYVGHIGCAPDGTAQVGEDCMFGTPGTTGFDNCVKGSVCGNYRGGEGKCKQLCDQQGGTPACDAQHVCVTYAGLFRTGGSMSPAAAGVCDRACDPLEDNDFDGSQSTLGAAGEKRLNTCGDDPKVGCYGYPSFGTPPKSGWSCTNDINYEKQQPVGLRHRVQCTSATECADGDDIFVNSCNQGYLPLLRESSVVSTAICVAMCKPLPCYEGGCGQNGINRHGQAPDACTDSDRVPAAGKTFDENAGAPSGGEHCHHLWWFEVSEQNELLLSERSDTMGFCYDHEAYKIDHDNNPQTDPVGAPSCATLGSAAQTGVLDATDYGCVPTSFLPTGANGKKVLPPDFMEQRRKMELPRALYRRTMGTR